MRIATKSNWTGRVLMASRTDYARLRDREELKAPGIYILVGPPDEGLKDRVYVGETDDLVNRLDQHRQKDFWSRVVVCNASDDSLNKAHIRYLEARLISFARQADLAAIENSNNGSPVRLSEADTEDAETYLDELLVLLPVLGIRVFDIPQDATTTGGGTPGDHSSTVLHLSGPEASATGFDRPDGFLVREGSLARSATVASIGRGVLQVRELLTADGTLVEDRAQLRLTKPHSFASPSQAAAVFLGRSANGRVEWKDAQGRTLSAIQDNQTPEGIGD